MKLFKTILAAMLLAQASVSLAAAQLTVDFEIPDIRAAEYHRPYVAVWLENSERKQVLQLAIWLEKEKWHRDLRSWWRRGGSRIELPVDGISGATRKPGSYSVTGAADLPPGKYTMNVEAVREVGGREHIRIPFEWDNRSQQHVRAGESELGAIQFSITPE